MLSMIWAMGRNREIGLDNRLPWHLPNDLRHFRKVTEGKTVIMGLKTFESLGKPLPNRRNIVLHYQKIDVPGCEVALSIKEVMEMVRDDEEAFIIGGASIYGQFLKYASRLYITQIDHQFKADRYFPEVDMKAWKLVDKEKGIKDEKNPYDYYFLTYDHISMP